MMGEDNLFAKLRFKLLSYQSKIRKSYYKILGMSIGNKTFLDRIHVEWPGNVVIGSGCNIQSNTTFWVQSPYIKSNKISIGDNVFIGRNTEFNCCDSITIGNNCLIASSTVFVDSSHTFAKDELIAEQPSIRKGIIIEEDVWIGTGSKILYGVRLGKGCIIGAGAIVNKSVPPYEIWAGVPARKIGERKNKTAL
jgi:acetyltransferase-like isoleucine patch superfamily enzyme